MENKLIHKKLMDIMKEIEPIKKERENRQQGYKFRGIEDMYNTLQPLFVKHGVFALPKTKSVKYETIEKGQDKKIYIRIVEVDYTFIAPDGSSLTVTVPGEGLDYSDKGIGKAMSNAHKYALIQLFMIPTEDVKDSDESGEDVSTEVIKRREIEEKVIDYIAKASWPTKKKEAIIKGMKSHNDKYLEGILNGQLD